MAKPQATVTFEVQVVLVGSELEFAPDQKFLKDLLPFIRVSAGVEHNANDENNPLGVSTLSELGIEQIVRVRKIS